VKEEGSESGFEWHPDVVKAGEATGLAYDEKGFIKETAAK
jgi:hypothetical protein